MEFFERIENFGKKTPSEKASQVLARLATVIGDAPYTADLEVGNYIDLFSMRLEKAKRAYGKAKKALAHNQTRLSIEHSERGLLHYELAEIHAHTEAAPLSTSQTFITTPIDGSSELIIEKLQEAICRIKLLIEYKNIALSRELRAHLSAVVQILQDAIESYARNDDNDPTIVSDTATGGLIWCQYIYASLGRDSLYAPKQETRAVRGLFQLAWDAGIAAFEQFGHSMPGARSKIHALENFLQSAINAYLEGDVSGMENFVRLGTIESTALMKAAVRADVADPTASATADTDGREASEDGGERANLSFKKTAAAIIELLERHHSEPARALSSLAGMQKDVSSLKRAIREENWKEAAALVQSCRDYLGILSAEVASMTASSGI